MNSHPNFQTHKTLKIIVTNPYKNIPTNPNHKSNNIGVNKLYSLFQQNLIKKVTINPKTTQHI